MANHKAPAGQHGGRKPPKTSTNVKGSGRAAPVVPNEDAGLGELFVDPAPSKAHRRAAERRRELGRAPVEPGLPDTATSLKKDKKSARSPTHGELDARALARASLTCTRGPEEGLSLNLLEGHYTVGRARENSFVLKDIAASRLHLRIEVDAQGARVVDLGSGNGTRVNGKRISERPLRHGDRIEIGGSVLLYSESGRPSPKEGAIDDAQERVIRAAEKLAAELSERMRFEDDGASASEFEDGHVARTRAIQPNKKSKSPPGQQGAATRPPTKAAQLWKETFTNLPLDQIVPADQPLRGSNVGPFTPAASRAGGLGSESLSAPPPRREPLPRPPPLAMPQPIDDEISLSTSRSGSGSQLLSILVTALVVVVVGGGIVVLWMFRGGGGGAAQEQQVQQDFVQAMRRAELAAAAGDWLTTHEAATMALQLKPNDPIAATYQRDARNRLDRRQQDAAEPATPPSTAPPTAPPPTAPPPAPVVEARPIPPAPAVAPPPPAPVVKRAPAPAVKREPATKPKPRPKPRRTAMSEAEAQTRFESAVDALRERDNKKGCAILDEVAAKAPADSIWKEKAENLYTRRCD